MKNSTDSTGIFRRKLIWLLIAAVVLAGAGAFWLTRGDKASGNAATFAARRGLLEISVLEGGSLQALESQEIKCEVRVGYQGTKILRIVEEGYLVTEEDVRTGKVLCELDSSELQKQLVQQEIQYQSAAASLTDAQQNYEIQLGQNESDVKAAEQRARFARMDFDKYLGSSITENIVVEAGLDKFLAMVNSADFEQTPNALSSTLPRPVSSSVVAAANGASPIVTADSKEAPVQVLQAIAGVGESRNGNGNGNGNGASTSLPITIGTSEMDEYEIRPAAEMPRIRIDFTKYANLDALGDGEAKQKLRKLLDDLRVAEKDLGQAQTHLEGTRRLFGKGFVPQTELTRDEIAFDSSGLKVASARTTKDLFLEYEFPRTAEETLSKYSEAVRELDKARRVAVSRLAQARARLNSARGQYQVQLRQRNDLIDQLEKCALRAKKTGLVVYGGGRDEFNQEPIREGATVRERQSIITIPDMTRMAVNVKIHESYINKIQRGQKARITVDAYPDKQLSGEVTKVAVLPDSQNRWMNPDMKVYQTTITIDGTHEWVKPGMSAKVEVMVNRLSDVVYVPVQAITPNDGKQICYVLESGRPVRREVEIGEFTDEFIEIRKGLAEGERVLLRPPPQSEVEDAPSPVRTSEPATFAIDAKATKI